MKTCPSCGLEGPSIKHIYAELSGSIKDRHDLRAELATFRARLDRKKLAEVIENASIEASIKDDAIWIDYVTDKILVHLNGVR